MARKLSFRRENICLTRRSKIQHDLRVGLKSQLLTILDWGFGLNCCKMDFSINVTFWFTVQTCCTYFYSFLALKFMILHLFQFFDLFYFTFFFCLCFDVWIEIGQNTVSPPARCTNILQINLKQLVSCPWCTDNSMIFYVRKFWRMLHIYYKQKVN